MYTKLHQKNQQQQKWYLQNLKYQLRLLFHVSVRIQCGTRSNAPNWTNTQKLDLYLHSNRKSHVEIVITQKNVDKCTHVSQKWLLRGKNGDLTKISLARQRNLRRQLECNLRSYKKKIFALTLRLMNGKIDFDNCVIMSNIEKCVRANVHACGTHKETAS